MFSLLDAIRQEEFNILIRRGSIFEGGGWRGERCFQRGLHGAAEEFFVGIVFIGEAGVLGTAFFFTEAEDGGRTGGRGGNIELPRREGIELPRREGIRLFCGVGIELPRGEGLLCRGEVGWFRKGLELCRGGVGTGGLRGECGNLEPAIFVFCAFGSLRRDCKGRLIGGEVGGRREDIFEGEFEPAIFWGERLIVLNGGFFIRC